jgi:hypothetical protein
LNKLFKCGIRISFKETIAPHIKKSELISIKADLKLFAGGAGVIESEDVK